MIKSLNIISDIFTLDNARNIQPIKSINDSERTFLFIMLNFNSFVGNFRLLNIACYVTDDNIHETQIFSQLKK